MNAINTKAEPAPTKSAEFIDELLSHLWRAKHMSDATGDAFCSLLSHVRLEDKEARTAGDRVHVFLELLDDEITEADKYAQALEYVDFPEPVTSVGKHVDIQRDRAFREAVEAHRVAEAVLVAENRDDSAIDAASDASADAFRKMFETRAPNLRCLHEKMSLIQSSGGWATDGTIDALFDDVEYLARRYEIAQPQIEDVPVFTGRAVWDDLMSRYLAAKAEDDEYTERVYNPMLNGDVPVDEAEKKRIEERADFLQGQWHPLRHALIDMPAPDRQAYLWKLEWFLSDRDNHCWDDTLLDGLQADARRLLGGEG